MHDILIASCDQPRYEQLGVKGYHDNCADNFKMSLMAIGEPVIRVPGPFNIWMNIPVKEDGSYGWEAPVSKPCDSITQRAHLNCIADMSACPQDITPVNGVGTTPSELQFEVRPG